MGAPALRTSCQELATGPPPVPIATTRQQGAFLQLTPLRRLADDLRTKSGFLCWLAPSGGAVRQEFFLHSKWKLGLVLDCLSLLCSLELIPQATLVAKLVTVVEGLIIYSCIENSLGIELQIGA